MSDGFPADPVVSVPVESITDLPAALFQNPGVPVSAAALADAAHRVLRHTELEPMDPVADGRWVASTWLDDLHAALAAFDGTGEA